MFSRLKVSILVLVCALMVTASGSAAFAWHDFGHMVVACIAYQQLSPIIQARVNALLKMHPSYDEWSKTVLSSESPEARNRDVFMQAARWADTHRDDRTKNWHYIDKPFATDDDSPLPAIVAPNVVTQINEARKILASDASDGKKSEYLVFLIHFVGDIHQPAHCATRVTHDTPDGDAGANDVLLSSGKNLHAYWDYILGNSIVSKDASDYAALLPLAAADDAKNLDTNKWEDEGFALAKSKIYAAPIGVGKGPYTPDQNYANTALATSKARVAIAGARLANILNQELK